MGGPGRRFGVAVAAVVLLAPLAGCGDTRPDALPSPTAPAAAATLEPCTPTGRLDSIAKLNRFVSQVRGSDGFAGGDVGASVELQDGRQVYVFGDTLRGEDFVGQKFVHNSMLVFSPGCSRVVMPRDHGALVPDRGDGVGYWPMSIARVGRGDDDVLGVGLQRVRMTGGSGVFDFEILGPAIARFVVPRGGTPELLGVEDIGPDRVDTTVPMWGAAVALDDGWVYVYGTSRPPEGGFQGFALRVARTRPESISDPSTWSFWDGARWTADSDDAVELIGSDGGVSQTLSVFASGGRWYALSKRNEVLGTDLTIWTAPGPEGPFTAAVTAASIPSDAVTGTLRYLPLAHPELLPVPGTVVVSYSVNNTDPAVVRDDPRRYRPRFLRVELP